MTLKDGRFAQDAVYAGGGYLTVKVREGARGEHDRGRPERTWVPLNLMPDEWLRETKTAAEDASSLAACPLDQSWCNYENPSYSGRVRAERYSAFRY
jgi:hypothetical protein